MSDIFSFLRQQTQSSHKALEAQPPFNRMMKSDELSDKDYLIVLRVLQAFHSHASHWLVNLPAQQQHMLQCANVLQALQQDIAALSDTASEPATFEMSEVRAPASERAIAAGYVWMGSSLGGKLIERWLRTEMPHLPRNYYSQMKTVSEQWPAFIRTVASQGEYTSAQMAHTADTANALFTGLRRTATLMEQSETA